MGSEGLGNRARDSCLVLDLEREDRGQSFASDYRVVRIWHTRCERECLSETCKGR